MRLTLTPVAPPARDAWGRAVPASNRIGARRLASGRRVPPALVASVVAGSAPCPDCGSALVDHRLREVLGATSMRPVQVDDALELLQLGVDELALMRACSACDWSLTVEVR